mmetsp:Transcript_12661/g.51167  ORF Transcript_12661/g.51167 Transcript_12661/m.51167 type:complete len:207 (+) Transcript_12661:507-1127(+)
MVLAISVLLLSYAEAELQHGEHFCFEMVNLIQSSHSENFRIIRIRVMFIIMILQCQQDSRGKHSVHIEIRQSVARVRQPNSLQIYQSSDEDRLGTLKVLVQSLYIGFQREPLSPCSEKGSRNCCSNQQVFIAAVRIQRFPNGCNQVVLMHRHEFLILKARYGLHHHSLFTDNHLIFKHNPCSCQLSIVRSQSSLPSHAKHPKPSAL